MWEGAEWRSLELTVFGVLRPKGPSAPQGQVPKFAKKYDEGWWEYGGNGSGNIVGIW